LETRPNIESLPFMPSAAARAAGLGGGFPEDSADRFIFATALEMRAPLVTGHRRIQDSGHRSSKYRRAVSRSHGEPLG
jgi:PIN domain nuclease of toxin-antitoxin system